MFTNQSAELSLSAPCKSITAVKADRLESRFLLGGNCIPDDSANQLHVIRYHPDVNVVGSDASLYHPTGPIQELVASPNDRTLVLTLAERSNVVTLYKLPLSVMELTNEIMMDSDNADTYSTSAYGDSYRQDGSQHTNMSASMNSSFQSSSGASDTLETKLSLEASTPTCKMLDMTWKGMHLDVDDANSSPGDVLTLDDTGTVTQWDLSMGLAENMRTASATTKGNEQPPLFCTPRVVWDPHHGSALAVSWGQSVRFMDLRAAGVHDELGMSVHRAHRHGVTDMDYNPNKPFTMATSGLDGVIHFWDTRSTKRPLLTARGGHSHYAWRVSYNPFHDQLVLSTGTDAIANLWRVSTISSAPLLTMEDESSPAMGGIHNKEEGDDDSTAPNARVARHEAGDSIYGAAWSSADAWLYCTVAYDGRLALHHVPSKEKYKILL